VRALLRLLGFYKCDWGKNSDNTYFLKIDGRTVLIGGSEVKDFIKGAFGIYL
jgi:hypothetical protein